MSQPEGKKYKYNFNALRATGQGGSSNAIVPKDTAGIC